MRKNHYQTRQSAEILEYLQNRKGNHVHVNEMAEYFQEHGIEIGTTTIYRHLEKMVQDELVLKYMVEGSSACYEYVGDDGKKSDDHYHLKCEECGKLIHIHCEEIEELASHMMEHHQFRLNSARTVFYGICEECGRKHV